MDEVRCETEVLAGVIGHKRLINVFGEDPRPDEQFMAETLRTIYSVRVKARIGCGQIRRINLNAPRLEPLRTLHEAGSGTYPMFQKPITQKPIRTSIRRTPLKETIVGAWTLCIGLWSPALMMSALAYCLACMIGVLRFSRYWNMRVNWNELSALVLTRFLFRD